MEKKTHTDPLEAMAALCEDDGLKKRVRNEQKLTQLIDELVRRRVMRGLSQADIARASGMTPSKICRLENSFDESLRLEDVALYCKALDISFGMVLDDKQMTCAEKLRFHVEQMNRQLETIQELAEVCDDTKIIEGIHKFQANVLLQLAMRSNNHADRMLRHIYMVFGEPEELNSEEETPRLQVSTAPEPACV
ncbi:MAG: transcriptional regulator [Lentisphaeria bacterium]|nr:transcriptional regulator [Lentisphaeria bacterium]